MKTTKNLFLLGIFALFVLPFSASASHSPVEKSERKLTEAITAYTLTFPLSSFGKDIYIPTTLERNVPNGTREHKLGYSFEKDDEGTSNDGVSAGAVFVHNAEKEADGLYKIAAGKTAQLSIIVLLGVSKEDGSLYRMSLDELPFFVGDERTPQSLNPSELKHHKTNFEEVNYERPDEE